MGLRVSTKVGEDLEDVSFRGIDHNGYTYLAAGTSHSKEGPEAKVVVKDNKTFTIELDNGRVACQRGDWVMFEDISSGSHNYNMHLADEMEATSLEVGEQVYRTSLGGGILAWSGDKNRWVNDKGDRWAITAMKEWA